MERQLSEREEAADPLPQLVAGHPRAGLHPPVLDQLLAGEGTEVSLGVADVDREQHRRIIAGGSLKTDCCLDLQPVHKIVS